MLDVSALRQLRDQRLFEAWDGHVTRESIMASEQVVRSLIDALIALGPAAPEPKVQQAVHECVTRFNELDQGWICTIEREDICERLGQIVELCGMNGSADWIAENREW